MKTYLQLVIAGTVLGLVGACDDGSAPDASTSAASASADSHAGHDHGADGHGDDDADRASGGADAPEGSAGADGASPSEPSGNDQSATVPPEALRNPEADADGESADREFTEADLATAEGAVRIWVEAMARGDFETVIFATDPTSPVFKELQDMAASFAEAAANEDVPPAMTEWLIGVFTGPWKGAEMVVIAERENQAQFEVALSNGETKTVNLGRYGGSWRVIADDELMKPGKSIPEPPAVPQEGDAGN